MKSKKFFETILLIILSTISYVYVYTNVFHIFILLSNNKIYSIGDIISLSLPIIIGLNIIFYHHKKRIISIILTLFNTTIILKIIYYIIKEYLFFQIFRIEDLYLIYLSIITAILIINILNYKNKPTTYDNLIIILSIIVISVFYRYYLDTSFLFNRYQINYIGDTVIAKEYPIRLEYINQYLLSFIIGYVFLLIGNKIEDLK